MTEAERLFSAELEELSRIISDSAPLDRLRINARIQTALRQGYTAIMDAEEASEVAASTDREIVHK